MVIAYRIDGRYCCAKCLAATAAEQTVHSDTPAAALMADFWTGCVRCGCALSVDAGPTTVEHYRESEESV